MIPFQSFDPFSIFGIMREWYQGDEDDLHECTTTITEEGMKKTNIVRHFCCHGYERELGQHECAEVDMRQLEDCQRS